MSTHWTPTMTHWGAYDVRASGGRIVEVRPVAADGEPSAIGAGMPSALYDRCRLTVPMVREGWLHGDRAKGVGGRGSEPFVEVSWEQAFDLVATELVRVREQHGNRAIFGGSYGWGSAGRFHHAQSQVHRFLAMHGGYTDSVGSYSCAALEVILPHVIGGGPWDVFATSPQWDEIAEHTELLVAFGGIARKNAQVNAGGVGRHTVAAAQQRCRDAGVRFVNVGPVQDDVAADLDARWVAIRPNTDVALMLGLAHTIVDAGRHDREFLDRCCVGYDRFEAYLLGVSDGVPKDAAWASAITGIDAEAITALAHEMATRRTLVALSWSVQRADHGEQPYWMGVALAAITGSMGHPGGGFGAGYAASAAIGVRRARRKVAAFPQPRNPVSDRIPVARIADLLLHPGDVVDFDGKRVTYPDIRLVYWCGGNPFHHHQDLNRLVRAWQQPETIVVHEAWWTPTARFADIVLPVATALERNDFAVGAQDPSLRAMHRAAVAPGDAPADYAIFAAVADRLGFGERFTEGRSADEWVHELYARTRSGLADEGVELPPFDDFWSRGQVEIDEPVADASDAIGDLRRDPVAHPLSTPSGRIELFSETIDAMGYDDCPGHPAWLEPAEWLGSPQTRRHPLHLVSNQPRTRLHSQYDNGAASRAAKIADREPLTMNVDDAAARGLADGDVVRVFNDRGACLVGLVVSAGVRPGVVQLATGAWYDPEQPGTPGTLDRHGNPNVLTLDKGTSRLAQGPSSNTTLVQVERLTGDLPRVGAFDPPTVTPSATR